VVHGYHAPVHAPNRPGVTKPPMRASWGNTRLVPQRARQPRRQTRRDVLTRLTQVGLLAAGVGLSAACDRLPWQAARVPRIGYVANQTPAGDADNNAAFQALVAGLGDYGYVQGQSIEIESRWPTTVPEMPEMVSELLRWGVDVLVTGGTAATQAAKLATSTVPIVGIYVVGDPVGPGLVQSLARPGGNVTAITQGSSEITGKWLELLRLIEPTLRHVGFVYNPQNAGHVTTWEQLSTLAAASGLEAVPADVLTYTIADLDVAFEAAVAKGAEAFVVLTLGVEGNTRLGALALSRHLVSLGSDSTYPAAGGLMSYGAAKLAIYRRGAYCVDRILKGAKPADLPVEFPTSFDLVVNHTTVIALGVTIPDEVAIQVTSWI
jgi:putative tryptophan/tyrosine transport system substrate-binding protein